MSPYQRALTDVVRRSMEDSQDGSGRGGGGTGINNTVMEMRTICNHPLLRCAPTSGQCLAVGMPLGLCLITRVRAAALAVGGRVIL